IGQNDADDPALLVLEQVIKPMRLARKRTREHVRDVRERARAVGGKQRGLEHLVLVRLHVWTKHCVKIQASKVNDREACLGLIPGAARTGMQPPDCKVAVTS